MAAPTPRPMIAVSEIGVSRTRSPNRSASPRVSPKTLPPAPTSMPATNTRSSLGELGLERAMRMASMVRKTGASSAGRRRLGAGRSWPHDEVGQAWRRPGWRAGGPPRPRRRARRPTDASSALISSSPTPACRSRPAWTSSGSRAAHSLDLLRRPVALGIAFVVAVPAVGGRLDDERAASGSRAGDHVLHGRRRRHRRRCRRRRRRRCRSRRPVARASAACWVEAGENSA